MTEKSEQKNLYEMLGGQKAVDLAVEIFYRHVLQDDRVNYFFESTDMDEQIAKQKGFLTMVFGGPNQYTGLDMRRAHGHLLKQGLNDSHVDVILELLGKALAELCVPQKLIHEVIEKANTVRSDILNR